MKAKRFLFLLFKAFFHKKTWGVYEVCIYLPNKSEQYIL